jgi:hypothetical protein
MGELFCVHTNIRSACKILVGKHEGKRSSGEPTNIREMDLQQTEFEDEG